MRSQERLSRKEIKFTGIVRTSAGDFKERYGSWALVAGAAEGLGRAFALSLAGRGFGLILVDLQEEPLRRLGAELEKNSRVPVRLLHLDLAHPDAAGELMKAIEETSCRLLVYNAAYSRVKGFSENTEPELERYVDVNVRTPLRLMRANILYQKEHQGERKGIILMSSLAGSWGSRLLAPYGATKAFTQILSESLYNEWREEGFDFLAAITGATATPGYLGSLPEKRDPPGSVMKPDAVVEEILRALGRSPLVIPGFTNKLVYFLLSRILPRRTSLRIMDRAVARLYRRD